MRRIGTPSLRWGREAIGIEQVPAGPQDRRTELASDNVMSEESPERGQGIGVGVGGMSTASHRMGATY